MIIVQLTGGLGNQLFQYAMGRSLALKHGVELKLDLSFFNNYEWHNYSLAPFNIKENFASEEECEKIKKKHLLLPNKITRKLFNFGYFVYTEKKMSYDEFYLNISSPAYLIGYWQCEEYFKKYSSILKEDFQIKIQPSIDNSKILNKIKNKNSVSLHIRRGNYVNNKNVNAVHGVCSMEYYNKAIEYICQQIDSPIFYVFSDDIEWAKSNFEQNHPFVFVDINDANHDYEDLRLMYNCKAHIIANSTFSWWGAWLNSSNQKIIVAPKQWFAKDNLNKDAQTIIPYNWFRI